MGNEPRGAHIYVPKGPAGSGGALGGHARPAAGNADCPAGFWVTPPGSGRSKLGFL